MVGQDQPDHFKGVGKALKLKGIESQRVSAARRSIQLDPATRVVVISDLFSSVCLRALKDAQRIGASTVLLMDGIVEWRNTYKNPRVWDNFLQPAPVDVIACAGALDESTLRSMGNRAVATGLPRLAPNARLPMPQTNTLLIATAQTPAFNPEERDRLLQALSNIKEQIQNLNIHPIWRMTGGLDKDLGVELSQDSLTQDLALSDAVITTPSTLMLEAMMAGRPTALLHPHPCTCWQKDYALWLYDGSEYYIQTAGLRITDSQSMIQALMKPTLSSMAKQDLFLAELHQQHEPPAEKMADLCTSLCAQINSRRTEDKPERIIPTYKKMVTPVPAELKRPRVVLCIPVDDSPVGGVTSWALRMNRIFKIRSFDVHTLLIALNPEVWPRNDENNWLDENTHLCVIDPTEDHYQILDMITESIAKLNPAIVIPNYLDACYASSAHLHHKGVRCIAVAHTDDEYYRTLLTSYPIWDAAVGVSSEIKKWISCIAPKKLIKTIPYAVPVRDKPRKINQDGIFRCAYIGRMIETQKRISDLLAVIDHLEQMKIECEFHMIGDGPHLTEWLGKLKLRSLGFVKVIIHGRVKPSQVHKILPAIDASVLVSEYEGTSVTMLEAMSVGVVPVVTRVNSGASEWIEDGINGFLTPIASPQTTAETLAKLAKNRIRLKSMSQAAWKTVKNRMNVSIMADEYEALFQSVLRQNPANQASDCSVRLFESNRWTKDWVEDEAAAVQSVCNRLATAGYTRISINEPDPEADAVILNEHGTNANAGQLRNRKLGVARLPDLLETSLFDQAYSLLESAVKSGHERIAVYGNGKHTQGLSRLFSLDLPIVCVVDDHAQAEQEAFGLPCVVLDDAVNTYQITAILLSSQAWEQHMWDSCSGYAENCIKVMPLYGSYRSVSKNMVSYK